MGNKTQMEPMTVALLNAGVGGAADRSIAEKLAEVAKVEDFMTRYKLQQAGGNGVN